MGKFTAISSGSEKAKKIVDFLVKELDMPEHVVGFSLEMRMDDVVRVTNMEYLPVDKAE